MLGVESLWNTGFGKLGWGLQVWIVICGLWGGPEGRHACGDHFRVFWLIQLGCHRRRDFSVTQILLPVPGEQSGSQKGRDHQGPGYLPVPSICYPKGLVLDPRHIQGYEFTAFQLLFVSQMPVPQGTLKITQWLIAFLKITACKVLR